MPQHARPPRRSLREEHAHKRPLHMIQRFSLLAVLAVLTVAVPLSGFVEADHALAVPSRSVAVAAQESWASVEQGDDATGSPLKAEPIAVTRARLQEAVGTCTAQSAASGDRQAFSNDHPIYFPLQRGSFRVSSPFGYRVHPITHAVKLHEGADFAASIGTDVHAVADGTVDFVGPNGGGGNTVRLRHTDTDGSTYYTQYLHLVSGGTVVKVGQIVKAGQVISHVGSTGGSTGPHLHFEVRPQLDKPIDPVPWLKAHKSVYLGEETCQ